MGESWTNTEVELIVADYFNMLVEELAGRSYNKAEHRRNLLPLLNNRSEGSIEFKHQNISAVLINHGQYYIPGYLPRYNYQKILEEKVLEYLYCNRGIEKHFEEFSQQGIFDKIIHPNFQKFIVEAPKMENIVAEPIVPYHRNPLKVNYLEKEQRNRKIGLYGEKLVMEYEKWNLIKAGKENLADKIEWISQELGDGAGFDILQKISTALINILK